MTRKRERLEVIKDVLESVRANRKIKPTRLLYASNLSPQMFKEYISELIEKEFIKLEIDDDKKSAKQEKRFFVLTKKGFEFLQEYKIIEGFVQNFGL